MRSTNMIKNFQNFKNVNTSVNKNNKQIAIHRKKP